MSLSERIVIESDVLHFFWMRKFLETPNFSPICTVSGDYAYLRGLRIIDISDPENPEEVGFYDYLPGNKDVEVSGNFAYNIQYSSEMRGLYILDITDKENPEEIGSLDPQGSVNDVIVVDNFAYIAKGRDGLSIVDIENIENPVEVGTYDTPGYAGRISVDENVAYIADHDGGLQVINISNVENPEEVGSYDIQPGAAGIAIAEEYLFVINGIDRFWILDKSDPENLVEICQLRVPEASKFSRITVTDNFAYIVDYIDGLYIIDITDVENPELINFFETREDPFCVAIRNNLAFLGDRRGIHIIDITDPENLEEVVYYDPLGSPRDIKIIENIAYICHYRSIDSYSNYKISVMDIEDPESMEEMGFYDVPVNAYQSFISGENIFVAEGNSMGIYRFTPPNGVENDPDVQVLEEFLLYPTYPNPFNSTTTITYNLPQTSNITLQVYDISGRMFSQLFNGMQEAGIHAATVEAETWASGLYFVRLEAAGRVFTQKVMFIK